MDNPPETTLVSLIVDGSSARVELAREDKYNAMNVMMITELIEIFEWTAERSAGRQDALLDSNGNQYLRTLVLSGRGRHFCAGADINMMRDAGANTPEENRKDSERLDRLFNGLWSHPCFTIGAIQGVALGGGAGLIACLDYVISGVWVCGDFQVRGGSVSVHGVGPPLWFGRFCFQNSTSEFGISLNSIQEISICVFLSHF